MTVGICDKRMNIIDSIINTIKDVTPDSINNYIKYTPKELKEKVNRGTFPCDLIILSKLNGNTWDAVALAKSINKINPYCGIIFLIENNGFDENIYSVNHTYCIRNSYLKKYISKALDKYKSENNRIDNNNSICVYSKRIKRHIRTADIYFVEKEERKSFIVTPKERINTIEPLKRFEDMDSSKRLCRIHSGYVVNLEHVASKTKDTIIRDNGKKLPVSLTYSKHFNDMSNNFWGND
jgi:DNA-binding LytR/AlgR family response regulator